MSFGKHLGIFLTCFGCYLEVFGGRMFKPFFLIWERRFLSFGQLPARLLWNCCGISVRLQLSLLRVLLWDYCSSYGFAGIVVGLLCGRCGTAWELV